MASVSILITILLRYFLAKYSIHFLSKKSLNYPLGLMFWLITIRCELCIVTSQIFEFAREIHSCITNGLNIGYHIFNY